MCVGQDGCLNGSGTVEVDELNSRKFLGFNELTMLVKKLRSRVVGVHRERVRKVGQWKNLYRQTLGLARVFEHLMSSDHCGMVI